MRVLSVPFYVYPRDINLRETGLRKNWSVGHRFVLPRTNKGFG